jgi:hypothetical protein
MPIEQRFKSHLPYPLQHLRLAIARPFPGGSKTGKTTRYKTGQITRQLQLA